MLSINATVEGDKVVLRGLRELQSDMPQVIQRTLTRGAKGTHRESFDLLNGPAGMSGGYPVPAQTGHLKRLLEWVKPGESKTSNGLSFDAGNMEAIVYDSAEYSEAVHEGLGSSRKFGARRFITDGFERFNKGNRLAEIAAEEIAIEARKKGFK